MIKDKLQKLIDKDLDKNINNNILYLKENYDENALMFILSNAGFKVNENIILRYYPGSGFLCQDINERIYGKSPLCQNIERFLNRN
jgi:hypothetical protein